MSVKQSQFLKEGGIFKNLRDVSAKLKFYSVITEPKKSVS